MEGLFIALAGVKSTTYLIVMLADEAWNARVEMEGLMEDRRMELKRWRWVMEEEEVESSIIFKSLQRRVARENWVFDARAGYSGGVGVLLLRKAKGSVQFPW